MGVEKGGQSMLKDMFQEMTPFVEFPVSNVIDYIKKSCNEAMFQQILRVIKDSAISDKDAFFNFVKIIIK